MTFFISEIKIWGDFGHYMGRLWPLCNGIIHNPISRAESEPYDDIFGLVPRL